MQAELNSAERRDVLTGLVAGKTMKQGDLSNKRNGKLQGVQTIADGAFFECEVA